MKLTIDAAHGGIDPGTTSNNVKEKDLTLAISLYMQKRASDLGFQVSQTRTDDRTLIPVERTNLIKSFKPDLCISNHINAGGGTGAEIIHSIHSNGNLAATILKELKNTSMPIRKIFSKESSKKGNDYFFIHRLTMPPVPETLIIEYGFLDNKADFARLTDEKTRNQLIEAVLKGICSYYKIPYKIPTNPTSKPFKAYLQKGTAPEIEIPAEGIKLIDGTTWLQGKLLAKLLGGTATYRKEDNSALFNFLDE